MAFPVSHAGRMRDRASIHLTGLYSEPANMKRRRTAVRRRAASGHFGVHFSPRSKSARFRAVVGIALAGSPARDCLDSGRAFGSDVLPPEPAPEAGQVPVVWIGAVAGGNQLEKQRQPTVADRRMRFQAEDS